jgi:hypothetical protein
MSGRHSLLHSALDDDEWPLYPTKEPYYETETGWAPEPVWAFWRKEKSLSFPDIQTPDHQDHIRDSTQLPTTLSPPLQGVTIVHERLRLTHILSHTISVFNVSLCARKTNFNIIPIYERAF